ncbi:MAG TPA: amino acid permease [Bryobacteraceae bacterium]|jgi:APA family basic amino acid/polyamine antiporter|nr:amino acid permease [Bryobacteraceae bacterium]
MRELVRGLDLTSATALTIGSIIGTGVFFKAAIMSQQAGSPALVMLAWLVAGLMSLCGALTFAELGGMMPEAGGEYVYLRTAYGDLWAFLDGWMRFVVASGGIAALGVGFATFLSAVIPLEGVWARSTLHLLGRDVPWQLGTKEVVGIAVVLLFGLLNCIGVRFGGSLQTALTTAKVAGILIIVGGAFLLSKSGSLSNFSAPAKAPAGLPGITGMTAFGAAVLSALWACDGWAFMPMVAGEVKNPGRNVPRALIIGVLSVLTLYGLANLAYFYVLPFHEVASSNSTLHRDALPVAAKAAATFMGDRGPALLSIVFMISVAGALNGVILSMARIPYAMARNGVMFPKLGELGARSNAPVAAILAVTLWSCVLVLSGTFDQLTDLTIFGQWIFYGITASAVFVLRRRMPDAPRPYKTLGYPLTPALFLIGAVLLLANTLRSSPVEAVVGLVLIALGLPVYFYYRRKREA